MMQEETNVTDSTLISEAIERDGQGCLRIANIAAPIISLAICLFAFYFALGSRARQTPAPEPMVQVQPLYDYGTAVAIVSGSNQGLTGVVLKWDEGTCEYTVLVPIQYRPNVLDFKWLEDLREDQLERLPILHSNGPTDPPTNPPDHAGLLDT